MDCCWFQCQTDLKSDVEIFADKAKEMGLLHERIEELVSAHGLSDNVYLGCCGTISRTRSSTNRTGFNIDSYPFQLQSLHIAPIHSLV